MGFLLGRDWLSWNCIWMRGDTWVINNVSTINNKYSIVVLFMLMIGRAYTLWNTTCHGIFILTFFICCHAKGACFLSMVVLAPDFKPKGVKLQILILDAICYADTWFACLLTNLLQGVLIRWSTIEIGLLLSNISIYLCITNQLVLPCFMREVNYVQK